MTRLTSTAKRSAPKRALFFLVNALLLSSCANFHPLKDMKTLREPPPITVNVIVNGAPVAATSCEQKPHEEREP